MHVLFPQKERNQTRTSMAFGHYSASRSSWKIMMRMQQVSSMPVQIKIEMDFFLSRIIRRRFKPLTISGEGWCCSAIREMLSSLKASFSSSLNVETAWGCRW
jgi:hypothetical protein